MCRALHAYRDLPLWERFLTELGCDPVLSGPTDSRMLARASRIAPAEICLPARAMVGHALSLSESVGVLLVPRLVCRRRHGVPLFGCPKSLALPDLLRALLPTRTRVVELTVDERAHGDGTSLHRTARALGATRARSRKAVRAALETPDTRSSLLACRPAFTAGGIGGTHRTRIGVVGHAYLVGDDTLSLHLADRIAALGATPVLPRFTRLPWLPGPPALDWLYESELVAEARHMVETTGVEGLILATSFACGTAPVTAASILRDLARSIPAMTLVFDEHTAEAGLLTRLESFLDLVDMRRQS